MRPFFAAILAFFLTLDPILADQAVSSQFVRVDEDETAGRLQTTVTRYQKDGTVVDLLGAVHIADEAYFEELNRRFGDYEVLLFEMVGGEQLVDGEIPERQDKDKADSPVGVVGDVFTMFRTAMQLAAQSEVIDYGKKNFVHADLTLREFEKLQGEKGESIMGYALSAAIETQRADPSTSMDMGAVMSALLSGNANGLKLALMKTLGGQDDQVSKFAGESVIIGDRNAKCMQVLDGQLGAGRKRLGIFYGAAHLPDMEARLRQRGFRKTGETWLTAWDVPKPQAKN